MIRKSGLIKLDTYMFCTMSSLHVIKTYLHSVSYSSSGAKGSTVDISTLGQQTEVTTDTDLSTIKKEVLANVESAWRQEVSVWPPDLIWKIASALPICQVSETLKTQLENNKHFTDRFSVEMRIKTENLPEGINYHKYLMITSRKSEKKYIVDCTYKAFLLKCLQPKEVLELPEIFIEEFVDNDDLKIKLSDHKLPSHLHHLWLEELLVMGCFS